MPAHCIVLLSGGSTYHLVLFAIWCRLHEIYLWYASKLMMAFFVVVFHRVYAGVESSNVTLNVHKVVSSFLCRLLQPVWWLSSQGRECHIWEMGQRSVVFFVFYSVSSRLLNLRYRKHGNLGFCHFEESSNFFSMDDRDFVVTCSFQMTSLCHRWMFWRHWWGFEVGCYLRQSVWDCPLLGGVIWFVRLSCNRFLFAVHAKKIIGGIG